MKHMTRPLVLLILFAMLIAASLVFASCGVSPVATASASAEAAATQSVNSPTPAATATTASTPSIEPSPSRPPTPAPTNTAAQVPSPSPEKPAALLFGAAGGNLANGGSWCYADGVLYGMLMKGGKYGIYAQNKSGGKKLADGIGSQLNVLDGFLYYLSYPQGLLFKVPTDGSAKPRKLSDSAMLFLLVADSRIYYTLKDSAALYSMGTDGSGVKPVSTGKCYDLGGSGTTIYYTDTIKGAFCMLDTATGKTSTLPMKNRGFAQLMGGKVYYQNEADGMKLYCCNPDGSGRKVFYAKAVTAINVTDQYVYFSGSAGKGPVYRANPDGSDVKKVADVKAEFICLAGQDLYIVSDAGKVIICRADPTPTTAPASSSSAPSPQPVEPISYVNPRQYSAQYMVTIKNTGFTPSDIRLYLPLPGFWDAQKDVGITKISPKPNSQTVEKISGNAMLYWQMKGTPKKNASGEFVLSFDFTAYETNTHIDPAAVKPYVSSSPEVLQYTKEEMYIEASDPEIRNLANTLAGDDDNPYRMAKTFYDYIIDHTQYKLVGQGLNGAKYLLDKGFGECGDYSALFVALCRAKGIPARPVVGYWAVSGYDQTHVWAEFFLQGIGWIPVDATIGQQNPEKRSYYFGNMDNRRVILSKGYNTPLIPTGPDGFIAPILQTPLWWYWGSGKDGSLTLSRGWTVKPVN